MNIRLYLPIFLYFYCISCVNQGPKDQVNNQPQKRQFNASYTGSNLDHIAFPIGGIGAGMICLEGTGAISHVSVRNSADMYNEPLLFAAISVKGLENGAKVLEGPIPTWKYFERPNTARGGERTSYGLPRFQNVNFTTRFPFADIQMSDNDLPLSVKISGWSPFIPGDADNSSLPVGSLEYLFKNTG